MNIIIPNQGNPKVTGIEARKSLIALTIPFPVWIALAYLLGLTTAEILIVFIEPRTGMVVYGLLLMALLSLAALVLRRPDRQFLLALALPPLIRLLSLSLPLQQLPYLFWYLVIGIPLFLAAFLVTRVAQLSTVMLGLTSRLLFWQVLIGLSGIGLGYIEYFILRPIPLVAEFHWQQIWLQALILFVFTGLLEEVIYRGIMLYTALKSLGRMGVIFVSIVFMVMHLGYRSTYDLIFVLAVALFYGFAVRRTGSILGVTLSHGLINVSLFLIFPFLVKLPASLSTNASNVSPGFESPTAVSIFPAPAIPDQSVSTPPGLSSPTATAFAPATPTALDTLSHTVTPTPVLTLCVPPPPGWIVVTVRSGDTLAGLAQAYGTTPEMLIRANCILTDQLIPGASMFVPSPPTVTPLPVCGPPSDWVEYTVQFNDTLYQIGLMYGVSVTRLQLANCLGEQTIIYIGQKLYVPNFPARTQTTRSALPHKRMSSQIITPPLAMPTSPVEPVTTATYTQPLRKLWEPRRRFFLSVFS